MNKKSVNSPVRFAVVGIDHRHIYDLVVELQKAGAVCAGYCSTDGGPTSDHRVLAGMLERFPAMPQATTPQQFYDDPAITLIVTAAVPDERAGVAITAMRHGKDVLADKPGVTKPDQLALIEQVVQQTGRIFSICFSERHTVPATQVALKMVQEGAVGRVVQTLGLGPHRLNAALRPPWFFDATRFGGILVDIASHQIDQFLMFTGSEQAQVVYAHVGHFGSHTANDFQDFGELVLSAVPQNPAQQPGAGIRPTSAAHGYIRVDWFTPDGLSTWGDGRLVVTGTEGSLELRKYIDVQGRPGTDHLFLTDHQGMRYIDCSATPLTFFTQLLHDLQHRTETAMTQRHVFAVCRLALEAQAQAQLQWVPTKDPA